MHHARTDTSLSTELRPQCAVVGVYNHPQAALIAYYCLHALQHRGQEATGIVSAYWDQKHRRRFVSYKGEGLVLDVFTPDVLQNVLKGDAAIGHNRYSTTGSPSPANIQPFHITYRMGNLALAHNGNLTNTRSLRQQLQEEGAIFQSTTDSELFLHLIARSRQVTQLEQIREALRIARGAYSLVILTDTALIAVRDPHGFRPLAIGRLPVRDGQHAYVVASETCAFDLVGAEYVRDVRHNEIVVIDQDTVVTGEMKSYPVAEVTPEARHCIFEFIYFSRPDSTIFGHSVDAVRRRLGESLAKESPVLTDSPDDPVVVIPVPDSGNTAAVGYARANAEQGIPTQFDVGLIRSHYVGRTFIAPEQNQRELKVRTKFNTVRSVLSGRKVVVVDDSIVRGTTSKALIQLIRQAGPREVHLRVTAPPIRYPCKYGMDFPSYEELIANYYETEEEIGQAIGADSLRYLSLDSLLLSVPHEPGIGYCTACFTGEYPVAVEPELNKRVTEE
ncbi:MAG: amidophosphoribosyltransferase [Candidatus Kapabacteria bacterium]|nr:amidophosphoribosyltransferase [Candidatus Kapabacteria bacterium]MDW8012326.1 amidophosphoribosyltransferase [Bacteroidota bacterium]